MRLSQQHLKVFPSGVDTFDTDDIRRYLVSLFRDGIVSGFKASVVNNSIVLTPGVAIVDGVVLEYTQPITLPYGTTIDKDVMLVNKYSSDRRQSPQILENYSGEDPYIYLYAITSGSLNFDKVKYSISAARLETLNLKNEPEKYNSLISGGSADGLHTHSGVYYIETIKKILPDDSILSIPKEAVSAYVSINSIDMVNGAKVRCYISESGRVRCFAEKDGAVVKRGFANVHILIAKTTVAR